ncbi:cobyric acid synthase CobQ [Thermosipho africanus Ob7]|uniref:cobyric acid synthase n=1 Tax=Thermosipho africanus TaxID=2421 RepID=UPI000E0A499A|nr:cobyric acid synthase [Thermosipho africanus]RDI90491.1 cobyric acid synthase CobQ [Thermosipho africanus Ob7]
MVLMIQGTASNVGKTTIATALCRYFAKKGIDVVPFKAQNISLNSIVSDDGGEMAIAQYIQAIACNKKPSYIMNPILLKPDITGSQLIVKGKPVEKIKNKKYMYSSKEELLNIAYECLKNLEKKHELVIVEGSGSAAEINIKDISNMAIAKKANASVILVADIDRGGAFAQIAGTMVLFNKKERKLVKGYIFNKFKGDKKLLLDFPEKFGKRFNIKFLGTIEYFNHNLFEEDITPFKEGKGDLKVDILKLPHISNTFDFEPLFLNTNARYVENIREDVDLIIIPGTKSTIHDLLWLKEKNTQIKKALSKGAFLFGICGGYQMLGKKLVEEEKEYEGLGYLNSYTYFIDKKTVRNVFAKEKLFNTTVKGFEIHHGITKSFEKPFSKIYFNKKVIKDGAIKDNIFATYIHNIFHNNDFLEKFLNFLRIQRGYSKRDIVIRTLEDEIDRVTEIITSSLNMKEIEKIVYSSN